MKKITLLFALFAFATSFGQRVEQRVPTLERSSAAQQTRANEESAQSGVSGTSDALLTNYLQRLNGSVESNPVIISRQTAPWQQPGFVFTQQENAEFTQGQQGNITQTRTDVNRPAQSNIVMSHSVDNETLAAGTIACGGGGTTRENSWFRTYTPADFGYSGDIQIEGLEFAYTFAGAGADGTGVIRAWTSDAVFPAGTYTQIAEAQMTYDLAGADVKTFFAFDVPVLVDANTEIIVEVFAEDDPDNDIRLYDNNAGETAPGYVFSATCGLTVPTAFGDIGFPDNHIILDLVASEPAGGGAPCAYENPSNGWENGFNYGGAFGAVENDFVVESGVTFDFDQITYNTFHVVGETVVSVDVEIKEDAGGAPGAVIASFPAVAPTSQTLIGGNFGFDGSEVVLDMPAVTLEEGTYWVALNNGVSSLGGPLFWEVTSASIVGQPSYQDGAVADPTLDGVYSFSGECTTAATVINFDPAATYIGYMNVFETPANGGGFVFGSPWGVSDLKTVVEPTPVTGSVTLYPNFNTYDDNPTDPFWVDQTTGLGNKSMEANTYVDDPSLAQQELLWTGYVISNTIDPAYEAVAFIKVFNANFSVLKIETAPLVEGEFFEVSYTNVEPDDTFVQYGWYVRGLNASSANEAALGNVVIGTEAPGCGDFTYVNEVPTGGGPPAQIFPDFPDFTSIAVDDVFFSGDAGLICSIDIQGRYTEGAPGLPGDPNGAVQLTIYKDDGGVPGAVHYEQTFPGSVDADGYDNFTLQPTQVINATLNPDTRYWISVAVVMEFGLGGQWFWGSAEDTNDNAALWQNPGGGFGVCPTWGTFADCGVGGGLGPDLLMDVNLVTTDPLTYDVCYGARTIECGDTLTGDTLSATVEAGLTECGTSITAPGVWYVFEDNSGLASEVLLSTCNQADYDTKLYVFTGSCGDLVCIDGNDDTTGCSGFTTELEFVSDGNSTYYILVAGFSSATGTFDLSMECTLIPPPNNDIEDAIDLLAVGCPFTDEDVAMPAATEEDGTPAGCDISGAAGVWYEFTPEINGFITGTIASPAGVSSVTFYTAPDQSSTETDLVHVDYYQNQCLPGSSATIPVIGGQTYYCFVVNTGGITDIVFDNCQLGTASNEIEGFEFYPNPTRERISLAAAQNIESVVLYNILGQRMMEVNVDATTTELNVAHLAAGAYLMEVTVDGQTGTYKLIKQ